MRHPAAGEAPVNWTMILFFAVTGVHLVLLVLIFTALARGSRAAPAEMDGRKILRPSRALLWSAILLVLWALGGLGVIIDGLMRERGQLTSVLAGLPLMLIAGTVAAWAFARYSRHRIAWDEETVELRNWRGGTERHRWDDLAGAAERRRSTLQAGPAENPALGMAELELTFADGGVVRAAPNMIGYHRFVAEAKAMAEARDIAWKGLAKR